MARIVKIVNDSKPNFQNMSQQESLFKTSHPIDEQFCPEQQFLFANIKSFPTKITHDSCTYNSVSIFLDCSY